MSSKYTNSVGSKLEWRQWQMWKYVCAYRGLKSAEYIRLLIMRETATHTRSKDFQAWLEKTRKEERTSE